MNERLKSIANTLERRSAGNYVIDDELGSGGWSTVYAAHHTQTNSKVAIKVLRPELSAAIGAERFTREIDFIRRLTHPGIVRFLDAGELEGLLFYVMPYVKGGSLRDRLKRNRQLAFEEAARVGREVAAALSHAHAYGRLTSRYQARKYPAGQSPGLDQRFWDSAGNTKQW